MKLIVVAFKTTEDNSKEQVSYKEAIIGDDMKMSSVRELFGTYLFEAYFKDADSVDVKFVRDEKL